MRDLTQRSKHFKTYELECHGEGCCDHSSPADRRLLEFLDAFRDRVGQAVTLNRAFSCQAYNATLGSERTSQHPQATAADISLLPNLTPKQMAEIAAQCPHIGGIGLYSWGIHADVRGNHPNDTIVTWGNQ